MPEDNVKSTKKGGATPLLLGFVTALVFGWWIFPHVLFSTQEQPFNYSHQAHTKQNMECTDCHDYREDGSFIGIPSLESCVTCHPKILFGTPDEEIFINEYVKKNRPIPWKIYQKQPDNVYFSHIAHKNYDCTQCHPDIGNSSILPPYNENKLTGYTPYTMTMDACERCHAQNGASNGCFVCHH